MDIRQSYRFKIWPLMMRLLTIRSSSPWQPQRTKRIGQSGVAPQPSGNPGPAARPSNGRTAGRSRQTDPASLLLRRRHFDPRCWRQTRHAHWLAPNTDERHRRSLTESPTDRDGRDCPQARGAVEGLAVRPVLRGESDGLVNRCALVVQRRRRRKERRTGLARRKTVYRCRPVRHDLCICECNFGTRV